VTRGQRITKGDDSGALASARTFGRMSTRGFDRRLLLVIVAVVAVPFIAPFSVQGTLIRALEFSIIAVSLVLLIGWVGQISLAHASFVGIGALVTGMVARGLGLGFPVDIIAGTVAGALAALALGSVALRVRGLYLAVATLIFAWMGDAFLFRSDWLGVAGGASSIPNEQIGAAGGITSFDLTSRVVLFILFASIAASVVLAAANLRDTRTGRAFFAVRGSEMAAASLGINVMRTKLVAFGISGMLAGLAGGLFITEQRTVVPEQFFFTISLQYLAIAVVGGLTSLGGAIAAALLFAGLGELFFRVEALAGWLEIVSAGLLAVVLLAYPGGLAAVPDTARRLLPFLRDPGLPPKPRPVRKPLLQRVRTMLPEPKPKDPAAAKARRRERTGPADWLAEAQPTLARSSAVRAEQVDDATVEIPVATNGHGPTTLRAPARAPLEQDRAAGRVPVEVSGVTVRFGGLTAVNNASLTVRAGEIVGLIGPNGAGKTTLFNAILGLNDPAAGTVRLYGKDATPLPPYQRARLGVARTFQVLQLFNELTVADNLLVATYLHDHSTVLSNMAAGSVTLAAESSNRKRVEHVLELLGLSDIADEHVSGLSFGTLRMVELGRALVTGSKLLMLDEPASGLNDAETARLVKVIRDVRDLGVSVLLIEHDVPMVCGVSDFVYVLDQGKMIAADTPAAVQRDPDVIAAYIGGSADPADGAEPVAEAEVGV
jgi:ABC-type branched-subunit amino acid transport system ATPase component/ABC-type branched-subunit amino acid transport system permease subunit